MLVEKIISCTRSKKLLNKINLSLLSNIEKANLLREGTIHKSLSHPHIIKYIDSFQDENYHYILQENACNGNLFLYIDYNNGLGEDLAVKFLYQIARAIQYLHSMDIIHRDIKPENILLNQDFFIKLCDFGCACKLDNDSKRTSICGTYEYMSPEVVDNPFLCGQSKKVDIWGLGILFYEMLEGLITRPSTLPL